MNAVGNLSTGEALKRFDTTGSPIDICGVRMTSKGQVEKCYETPYGSVIVARHVYQTSKGGKTYCPLDHNARIITNTTPRFAKMISHKYARGGAKEVSEDLSINHGRSVARSFLQNVANTVGSIAQSTEESWEYSIPTQNDAVKTVSVSLDGTCIYMLKDGYREAMVGTVSLYNPSGERLDSIYIGASPEYGKEDFLSRLKKEVESVKLQYPDATYVGVADGAKINWEFLNSHTSIQILDFYHATEYLADVSRAIAYKDNPKQKTWMNDACHRLKHDKNAADDLFEEMMNISTEKLPENIVTKLESAITYFKNQKHRMNYYEYSKQHLPIGSGVTEAACKTIVKQRLCQSGMKWGEKGARLVLALRALIYSKTRFEQFWQKIINIGHR